MVLPEDVGALFECCPEYGQTGNNLAIKLGLILYVEEVRFNAIASPPLQ